MRRTHLPSGFTLVEMLVSIVVFVLLVVLVSQLTNSATAVTHLSGKRMDSDNQARGIFDRMATDLSGIIRRQDVDYLFAKQAGNDTMYVFSEAPRYFDSPIGDPAKSPIALLGYRVNSSFQLERLSQGLTWDGVPSSTTPGAMLFLTYAAGSSTPNPSSTLSANWASVVGTSGSGYSDGSSSNYHVVGDQVYRLEISYLQKDGTLSNSVTSYNGLQGIVGVNVAVAMLDNTSRTILLQNSQLPTNLGNQMVAALPDSVALTPTIATWRASNYLTNSNIPQEAASQLRIYERIFYVGAP